MGETTTSTAPSLGLLYTPIRTYAPTPDGLSCPPLLFLFFFFFFFLSIFFLWARGKQTDLLKHPSSLVCRCGFEGRTLCPAIQKSRTKKKKRKKARRKKHFITEERYTEEKKLPRRRRLLCVFLCLWPSKKPVRCFIICNLT